MMFRFFFLSSLAALQSSAFLVTKNYASSCVTTKWCHEPVCCRMTKAPSSRDADDDSSQQEAPISGGEATDTTRKEKNRNKNISGNDENRSRRRFIQNSAAAIATATATSALSLPSSNDGMMIARAATGAKGTSSSSKKSTVELPPMGLGAWAWGDTVFWKYDKKQDKDLQDVFDYALTESKDGATVLFDTAEIYGFGRSETLLGEFSKNYPPEKVTIASKFGAFPWRTKPADVVKACEASVKRLGGRPIDLYQIHFPNAWSNAEYWDGLAMCYEKGLVKGVGVSNYGVDATKACYETLKERNIPLLTNQIQLSLLYRWPLQNELLKTCRDLGVRVLSYSPLGLGMLTGKYSRDNLPAGPRKAIYEQLIQTPDYENLLDAMKQVASNHGKDATQAQVAINWARSQGTIPIPGARTLRQVKQNYAALDWSLSKQEETMLNEAASKVTTFITPDKSPFPKEDINTKLIMFDS